MKFIRDIIADKREQSPPQPRQGADARSDHDMMASILSETGPATDPFPLDSRFQVSEPQSKAAAVPDHPPVLPEETPLASPAVTDRPAPAPDQEAQPLAPNPAQHPTPIRQKADAPAPVAPAPIVLTPMDHAPVAPPPVAQPPVERAPQRAAPETPVQPSLRAQAPQVETAPQAAPARPDPAQPIDVPSPAMGRGSSKAGRVKTRLLGFNPGQAAGADPFARTGDTATSGYTQYPVGWLAVVKGPGRGATFTLFSGVTIIGRGEDQTVRLDFGDNSISRANHAAIAFDPEQNSFFIGHGGKANLVRRNDRPVLSTEELAMGDLIRIGETTLRFVPLCGPEFGWTETPQSEAGHGA